MARKLNLDSVSVDDIEFWGPQLGEHTRNKGGMSIYWSSDFGFGELNIFMDNEGKLQAETERMDSQEDKAFTQKVMQRVIEKLIIIE